MQRFNNSCWMGEMVHESPWVESITVAASMNDVEMTSFLRAYNGPEKSNMIGYWEIDERAWTHTDLGMFGMRVGSTNVTFIITRDESTLRSADYVVGSNAMVREIRPDASLIDLSARRSYPLTTWLLELFCKEACSECQLASV